MLKESGDQPRIRERRAADLSEAAAALVEVHRRDGYPVEGVDDPVAWLVGPHQLQAWVAEREGRVVGHVALSDPHPDDAAATLWTTSAAGRHDDVAVLGRLFVLPAARGHSLGERLVHAATQYGHTRGRRLVLDVMAKDVAAIALYERLGWSRIGTTSHDDGHGNAFDAVCFVGPPADAADAAAALAAFGYELGVLKRIRRTGWWQAGVSDPESVAEHTMRVAQLAAILAAEEGADPARASFLALWHDTQETRTGDLPHTIHAYVVKPDPRRITADQTERLPEQSRGVIRTAVDEYEARQTAEARCAKDADKLEMLLQAVEYRDVGVRRVDEWIDSAREGLTTDTARRIADAALQLSPLAWRER